MRRKSGYIAWFIVILAVLALFLSWQFVGYRRASRTLPAGITLAGMPVEGMTREQALNALEVAYATPLEVTYEAVRLTLSPESVELRFDAEQTGLNLDAALEASEGVGGFLAHLLRRDLDPVDVPAAVSYSQERVDAFLARVAAQYDHPPQEPVSIPASLAFRAGQPGYEMDVTASRTLLSTALMLAPEHQVKMVVRTEAAPEMDSALLGELFSTLLEGHEGLIPGIFVKDLHTGQELGINADVAYDGLGVLKIAILAETYRALDLPLAPEVSDWISSTAGVTDSESDANRLLGHVVGGGDGYQGAETLNTSMTYLGLVNTFVAAPYDEPVSLTVATPANSRPDITTNPGPQMQTTPLDMGLLLEMVYQCSRGGGGLMVAYPGAFTAEECAQMIEWMSLNRIDSLIEVGVPSGTKVAHKQGVAGDTHADAGLVFGPRHDFVLVTFLYRPDWLPWEESAPLITDITTAAYNFFNAAE